MKENAVVGNPLTMRVANFRIGFESAVDYGTTTDQNNKFFGQDSSRQLVTKQHHEQVIAQKERVYMNRVPHYDFGRDKIDYGTINAGQFTKHDLSQVHASKIAALDNGKDVRKSHF